MCEIPLEPVEWLLTLGPPQLLPEVPRPSLNKGTVVGLPPDHSKWLPPTPAAVP